MVDREAAALVSSLWVFGCAIVIVRIMMVGAPFGRRSSPTVEIIDWLSALLTVALLGYTAIVTNDMAEVIASTALLAADFVFQLSRLLDRPNTTCVAQTAKAMIMLTLFHVYFEDSYQIALAFAILILYFASEVANRIDSAQKEIAPPAYAPVQP